MFRRLLAVWSALFFLLCSTSARSEWIATDSQTEPSNVLGVVHQHMVMANGDGDKATLDLAKFSPKSARLRLVDNSSGRELATAALEQNIVTGVNGGYFDGNFAPLGLRVADGKRLSPLTHARLLSGVVISSDSRIQILRSNELGKNRRTTTALQCGPFLIDHGAPVPGLDQTHTARRTFVAVTGSGDAILGSCSSASLAELPRILIGCAGNARIQRALNLDGGSSSAFWFKRKDGTVFSISEQKGVRDFLAVTPP